MSNSPESQRARRAKGRNLVVARAATREPKRARYAEPPTRKESFLSLRVPPSVIRAFTAVARRRGMMRTDLLREYVYKVSGIKLVSDGSEG